MSKKKIGIVTYWESNDNYGQQLQCWALQHFLRLQGHDAFLIRQYICPPKTKRGIKRIKKYIKDTLANCLFLTRLAYIPTITKYLGSCIDREASRRKFPLFRERYLKMSKIYNSPEKLVSNPPEADIYITGSDQVWNYAMPKEPLRNFFLQFGNDSIKRISYAPSIGYNNIPEERVDELKSYLRKFSSISVRESSAVILIEKLGYNAVSVLDPTMLLSYKDYLTLLHQESSKQSIFIYSMNYESKDDIPFDEIKEYAEQNQLPIIVTPGSGYVKAMELFDNVEYSYATIPQWISHIANAKLVITASFHGVIFSILFKRSFIYTPLKGAFSHSNNRVLDLLNILEFNNQVYDFNKDISDFNITSEQWDLVENKLNQLRLESINYLTKSINE